MPSSLDLLVSNPPPLLRRHTCVLMYNIKHNSRGNNPVRAAMYIYCNGVSVCVCVWHSARLHRNHCPLFVFYSSFFFFLFPIYVFYITGTYIIKTLRVRVYYYTKRWVVRWGPERPRHADRHPMTTVTKRVSVPTTFINCILHHTGHDTRDLLLGMGWVLGKSVWGVHADVEGYRIGVV